MKGVYTDILGLIVLIETLGLCGKKCPQILREPSFMCAYATCDKRTTSSVVAVPDSTQMRHKRNKSVHSWQPPAGSWIRYGIVSATEPVTEIGIARDFFTSVIKTIKGSIDWRWRVVDWLILLLLPHNKESSSFVASTIYSIVSIVYTFSSTELW